MAEPAEQTQAAPAASGNDNEKMARRNDLDWQEEYRQKLRTPEEAVRLVQSGDTVHIGTCSTLAYVLTEALYRRRDELSDVRISSATNSWLLPFYKDGPDSPFSVLTYFAGPAEREAMRHHNCHYTSLHLSQIDRWCKDFCTGCVAFFEVSPPDEAGYMSYGAYGVSMHDFIKECASRVVLQVNRQQPYVYGRQNLIHISEADAVVETDVPLAQVPDMPADETLTTISRHIVEQIPDGATIQLGLGSLSGAIGFGLEQRNDLGVHSEMFTNSMRHLMEMGVITNRKKNYLPGKAVVGFTLGPKELYEFVDHNPDLMFVPYSFVNNPYVIAKNDNMISVNTAMAVDLFGQVAADNIGGRQQSAVGGQVDYVRGAQLSRGGKSFIALPSTLENKKGRSSRIMAAFPPGTAITTSRQDVQHVVTEFGCVNLKPLTMDDRARALISLAHPDFRAELADQAKALGLL